jgi:hypothetical protein
LRRLLATPAVGFLFGCYLYISVNWWVPARHGRSGLLPTLPLG